MLVWSRKHFCWVELTPAEVDILADFGDAVAEGRMTAEEVIDLIIARREDSHQGGLAEAK